MIITLLLESLFFLFAPSRVLGSRLVWNKSEGIGSYSQEIRISPSSPSVVYATTRTPQGSGLFKSIDGGQNFIAKFPVVSNRDVNSIAISYVSPDKLCIGTFEQGVFCSLDGGENFNNSGWVSSGLAGLRVRFVTVDPTNDDIYFAGTGVSDDGGIFKTTNFGQSWVQVGQSTFGNRNSLNIIVDPSNNQRVFSGSNYGISRSLNGGLDWTDLPIPFHANQPATVIDKSFPAKVFAGTEYNGVYFSDNGGDSWIPRNTSIESAFIFRLAQDTTNILYASNRRQPGGVWKTSNEGVSWENISDPSWALQSTSNNDGWGLDIVQNRVIASIGQLGVFYADTNTSPPPVTHKSCQNNACAIVDGPGNDSCQTDAECAPPPPAQEVICDRLTVTPSSGEAPLTTRAEVQGHTNNGGFVTGFIFDFGDGSEIFKVPGNYYIHTYNFPGVYTVRGSVEDNLGNVAGGSGICQATLTVNNPPPPGPNPVVFVPGFATTWSYKGLVENQTTTSADWQLLPLFTDSYYKPLLSTLQNSGLEMDKSLFTFTYDFRQSVPDSAVWLKSFLTNRLPDKKANIVSHSMGGVIARYCFEQVPGCQNKINKIVTAGTPHQGTIKAYLLWEGGQIDESNPVIKTMEEIALHATNFPYLSDKDIVQNRFPGVRDTLPVFDYIIGHPYTSLSQKAKNPLLETLTASDAFRNILTTLSGSNLNTYAGFSPIGLNAADSALGLWADGKPGVFSYSSGDDTVLLASSQIASPAEKEYSSLHHADLLRKSESEEDILDAFGLTTTSIVTRSDQPSSVLAFIIHSPATISATGGTNIDGQAIFVADPSGSYPITITGTGDGNFLLESFFVQPNHPSVKQTFSGRISLGQSVILNYDADNQQLFSDQSGDILLASLRQQIKDSRIRAFGTIDATIVRAALDIKTYSRRVGAFNNLESAYTGCEKLLVTESSGVKRTIIENICQQIFSLTVNYAMIYGEPLGSARAATDLARANRSVSLALSARTLSARNATNIFLAQKYLATGQDRLSSGQNYQAHLFALAGTYLLSR